MLKEIIGRIVDAENKAENIEKEAVQKAQEIKIQAAAQAELLRHTPAKNIVEQRIQILQDAEEEAQRLAAEASENQIVDKIATAKINNAADAIVAEFLKRGI